MGELQGSNGDELERIHQHLPRTAGPAGHSAVSVFDVRDESGGPEMPPALVVSRQVTLGLRVKVYGRASSLLASEGFVTIDEMWEIGSIDNRTNSSPGLQ